MCNALTLRREAKIQYVCLGLLWYPEAEILINETLSPYCTSYN
ncbi:hypothetical protein M093_1524 [Bacteroides uniformis str. 3978 T3 i]|nr:hypothetical protein M093_1524 [Bacteroides uniformis str. 3978 T3 i]